MQNVLTKQPQIGNIQELLGDAHGAPPDAANILSAAHRARKAKKSGNRDEWRDSVNEILWTARKSQLTQDKKMLEIEKKNFAEIQKMHDKMSKNELQLKMFNEGLSQKAIEAFDAGNDSIAYKYLAVRGIDPGLYKTLGEHLYHRDAIKANEGDPEAQKRIRIIRGTPEAQRNLIIYDLYLREGIEEQQNPTITGSQTQGQPQQQPQPQNFLPPGVDANDMNRQDMLNQHLGPKSRAPDLSRTDINAPMYQTTAEMQQGQDGSWTGQDYDNYLKFQGKIPTAAKTEPKVSDDVQLLQFAIENDKSPEEALEWLQKFKAKTDSGLTGDAALFQELRREFPHASMEELRTFFQSSTAAKETAENDDRTAKQKDWSDNIEPALEKLGIKKYTPEWAEKFMTHWGLTKDPKTMKIVQQIAQDPKLLSSDKDGLLAIAQLPRSVNTPDAVGGAHLQIQRIRQRQGALFGNMDTYLEDPQAAIKNAAETAKRDGKLDAFIDTIFPDHDKGLGILLTNKFFPTTFDREVLQVIRRNTNVQSVGIGTQKLADADKMARDIFSLLAYFKHAIKDEKIYNAAIPFAVRSKLTGLAALMGMQPITNEEVQASVHAGKSFALFMKFISGAAVAENEAARLLKTFVSLGDTKEMSYAKVEAMYNDVRDGLINHYTSALDRETAEKIAELIIDESYDPEHRTSGTIDNWVRSFRTTGAIEKLTYGQIMGKLTDEASTFMKAGEEFTKTQLTEARQALGNIRREKLLKAGNPSDMFTEKFTKDKKASQLQDWISNTEDPVSVFESITDWMPLDISKDANRLTADIQAHLDKFEDRYLDALRQTGKLTTEIKEELSATKKRVRNTKILEISAFNSETASEFVTKIKSHPKSEEIIKAYGWSDTQLRKMWLDIQKRGF